MAAETPASDGATLARGAVVMTIATAASRITGFIRVLTVAAAMGTTFLASTYQTANTAPNMLFELVAAGVLTSIFVPTFVDYIARGREKEGWGAANAMTTVALVGLTGLAIVLALIAPLLMRALTVAVEDPQLRNQEIALGARFLRLFAPQVVFYGAGMIMTGALHAHRRFAMPAIAPIFNNLVVIAVYLAYMAMRDGRNPTIGGITDGEVFLLGAGTTAGVVAMTLCLVPGLRRLGWRYRWNFDIDHVAVRKAGRLGIWALGYAGGYQAGLIVVLILANRVEGGVAAYQWAYTFFYMPHALFAVPIFNVLFTAMSEHAVRDERGALSERLITGLRMLAFILFPIAAVLIAAAAPLTTLTLEYGVMTDEGARLIGTVLRAFAVGLPAFSSFLVLTRAFYAMSDTKTPALVNAIGVVASSIFGAIFFFTLPEGWEVAGLALGHSVGFGIAAWVGFGLFDRGKARLRMPGFGRSIARSALVAVAAFVAMAVAAAIVAEDGKGRASLALLLVTGVGAAVYVGLMRYLKAPELERVWLLVRGSRR